MTPPSPSRRQVKNFQFIQGKPVDDPEDKENAHLQTDAQPTQPPRAASPPAVPSTPASRLPLVDLIGDTDESHTLPVASQHLPRDRIQWNTVRSPTSASSRATPAVKARKRARSSSPPSASQCPSKRQRADLEQHPPQQPLRTPVPDPAAHLWARFNIDSGRDTGLLGALATALPSSSPYTDESGNVSGLRRWTSCGVEWPSSKRKKPSPSKRASRNPQDVFIEFQQEPDSEAPGGKETKPSKMGSLLERIQESLALAKQPRPEHDGPSSSSPLPDKTEHFDRQSISPCRGPALAAERDEQSPTNARKRSRSPHLTTLQQKPPSASTSFGSGSSGMALAAAALSEHSGDAKSMHGLDQGRQPRPADCSSKVDLVHDDDDDDEFGGDFDLSADDFDSMAGLHDSIKPDNGIARDSDDILGARPSGTDPEDDEDIDEELFAAAEASATQATSAAAARTASPRSGKQAKIQRYQVRDVLDGQYSDPHGRQCPEQVVLVQDEESKAVKTIMLRESWLHTRCTKGSYVHVIGAFDKHGHCVVNDSQNILILHPDHLISALVVADSYSCMRKAVLQDRIKATSETSPPMLYGTIIHEIFQEALQHNAWDAQWLSRKIDELVERHIEDLYKTGLNVQQATEHLQSKLPGIQSWAETFLKTVPDDSSRVKDLHGKRLGLSVNKLLDVEEHIWSPMYGLKGNIDATVQVTVDDESGRRTLTVPLELKTGKREMASHRAQTALYTLMLSDRYDVSVVHGVLYYVESGEMSRIPAIRHELRHLIMQRNELACYVRERLSLPPMLRNTHTCSSCYAKTPCFLYHKLGEGGNGETSGLRDKFDALTKHLQPAHQIFFQKWDDLLTKEESEMMRFRRELWTMLSKEREKLGRCFANVTLIPSSSVLDNVASKINRYSYVFKKHDEVPKFSFSESQISVGEPIVVSDENGHYALARGYVTAISRSRITVAVDRRLHNARTRQAGFHAKTNQTFAGVMSVEGIGASALTVPDKSLQYRLDKDEFSNGMALTRNNLIQMMTHDVFRARGLQSLIVDKRQPSFKALPSSYTISGPSSQSNVNADQRAAIDKILSAEDYALVLGMPGTGKTTTIAHIIRALVTKGKSVLLASYTHTAVDNILLKVRSRDIPVLRLGALAKIHPEVKQFASLAEEPCSSTEELHAKWHDPLVVATTCLGVNHPIFQQRLFDYCIVDEASQITLPVCLGPIRMARIFVLVGDHYQLPPLVQNDEAKQGGLDVSLFKDLSEAHPDAVATLSEQYRMNEPIMSLSSKLIYGGRLKCGSPTVAAQRLILPHFDALTQLHRQSSSAPSSSDIVGTQSCPSLASPLCLIATAFAPSSPPVVFLNTDSLQPASAEIRHGPRVTNPLEASLSVQLVRSLLHAGLPPSSIGVITLYRSQLALIKQELVLALGSEAATIEAHTADKYQGRDKEVIIVSFVKSNDANEIGDLLKDQRRVNVSITRAKRKLVLLGSRRTLERGDELLGKLVGLCAEGGGMVDVPATWSHHFGSGAMPTQSITTSARQSDVEPARKVLGEVATNVAASKVDAAAKSGTPKANPSYKNPLPTGKTPAKMIQGQRRITHSMMAQRPVMTDLMYEVIGEELSQ